MEMNMDLSTVNSVVLQHKATKEVWNYDDYSIPLFSAVWGDPDKY